MFFKIKKLFFLAEKCKKVADSGVSSWAGNLSAITRWQRSPHLSCAEWAGTEATPVPRDHYPSGHRRAWRIHQPPQPYEDTHVYNLHNSWHNNMLTLLLLHARPDTHTHTHTPRHTLDPQWTTVTKGDKSHFHCRLKCMFYKQWGWDCFQAGSGMKWFQLLMWPL